MAPSNSAAWLTGPKVYPLEVKEAPYSTPDANEITIKNAVIAINIVDYKMQDPSPFPNTYPAILGQDVAGTVTAVGPGVTRFKEGDRVLGQTNAMLSKQAKNGAYQAYTVLADNLAAKIPESLSFERAAVVPLSIGTAACGMYQPDFLDLQRPSPTGAPSTSKTLFIWGGSSAVGIAAIQLAKASGYETVVTSSARNHDLLRRLGATHTIDYNDANVVDTVLSVLKGKQLAGTLQLADGNGEDVRAAIGQILVRHQGGGFYATATDHNIKDLAEGVTTRFIFGLTLWKNDIGKAIYEDFLPAALENGSFVASPEPEVVGHGLGDLQQAVDKRKSGKPSARKMVVVL